MEKLSIFNSRAPSWGQKELYNSGGNPSRPGELPLFIDLMAFLSSSRVTVMIMNRQTLGAA